MKEGNNWEIPKTSYLEGLRLCKKNAERLHSKANELLNKKQFLAAYLIGFVAYEEFGKALLILEYWDNENISKNQRDNLFKIHKKKITIATSQMAKAFKKLHANEEEIDFSTYKLDKKDTIMIDDFVKMRTACLYVNYNEDLQKFIEPELDEKIIIKYAKKVFLIGADCGTTLNQEIFNKNIKLI